VARKNPLGKLKDAAIETAIETIKHPIGSAEKAVGTAVGQVHGAAAIGKMVAGQVTRTAATMALGGVEAVATRAGRGQGAPRRPEAEATSTADPVARPDISAVPDPEAPPRKGAGVNAASGSATAKETAARKLPAGQTPSTRTAATNTAAAKPATAKKAPVKKAPAKKAPATKASESIPTPADVAKVVKKAPAKTAAVKKTAPTAPAKKASSPGDRLPPRKAADNGPAGGPTGAPAQAAAAKKAPTKNAPAKKAAAKKATSAPQRETPLTAQQVLDMEGPEITTPVGTTAAGVASNPDTAETDLQQPGTEPLMDPSLTKKVASESATGRRASDVDKG